MMTFFSDLTSFLKEREGREEMAPFVIPLAAAAGDLEKATMWFMQNAMAKPDNAGAGSTDYMHLMGLVVLGYMWAQMAETALEKQASPNGVDKSFLDRKLTLARFFMERLLPETKMRLARIEASAETMMSLPAEAF
ncbi:MAG: acyl-CoA dehydrogenase C-terminal domain-containing protein, partial [Pseudomonadota bacterium]